MWTEWLLVLLGSVGLCAWLCLAYYWSWARATGVKVLHRPILPFIGNWWPVLTLRISRSELYVKIYREHEGTDSVGTFGLLKPALVLRNPRDVLKVLTEDFDHFVDRDILGDSKLSEVDAGLIVLNGAAWKSSRQMLSPAFTTTNIKSMIDQITDRAQLLVQYLDRNEGLELDVREPTSMYSTDVVASCFFGLEANCTVEPDCKFRRMSKRVFHMSVVHLMLFLVGSGLPAWSGPPWNLFRRLIPASLTPPDLNAYFASVITDALRHRRAGPFYRKDYLQLLIDLQEKHKDTGKSLSDSNIVAHAYTFLSAGLDTTSLALGFVLLELGLQPTLQERARREVLHVLGQDTRPTYQHLRDMTFLENCVRETLRLYPAVASLYRLCTKPYTFENGVRVSVDDAIVLPLLGFHTDPIYFTDPLTFNPDRFTSDYIQKGTYFPFGDGPRICIGMHFAMISIKLALAMILSNFEIIPSPKTNLPVEFDAKGFTLIPKKPVWCSFIRLNKNNASEEA